MKLDLLHKSLKLKLLEDSKLNLTRIEVYFCIRMTVWGSEVSRELTENQDRTMMV